MTKAVEYKKDQPFGRLTVIARASNDEYGRTRWYCRCSCGNRVVVRQRNLERGKTTSCGCYKIDKATALLDKVRPNKHISLRSFIQTNRIQDSH